MHKTCIVVGRSYFLKDFDFSILDNIKATKVCINHSIEGFDYMACLDKNTEWLNLHNLPMICPPYIAKSDENYNLGGCDQAVYNKIDNSLTYYGFTHDFVIAWAIHKGFENIILVGAADFDSNKHYNNFQIFNPKKYAMNNSIDKINNLYAKCCKIYTMNPNSKLNVDRLTIEDLKKWH